MNRSKNIMSCCFKRWEGHGEKEKRKEGRRLHCAPIITYQAYLDVLLAVFVKLNNLTGEAFIIVIKLNSAKKMA